MVICGSPTDTPCSALRKTGVIDRILGEGPQPTRLGPIAGIFSDPRGRIYAIDSRTGSIHVFDQSGNLLNVCQAKPTDFKHEILFPALTVNDKGDVYLGLGRMAFRTGGEPTHTIAQTGDGSTMSSCRQESASSSREAATWWRCAITTSAW